MVLSMTTASLHWTLVSMILAYAVLLLLPVRCGSSPPFEDTEWLQQYLWDFVQDSNHDLHQILPPRASPNHVQEQNARMGSADPYHAPTFQPFTTPSVPLHPPPNQAQIHSALGISHPASLSDSVLVSSRATDHHSSGYVEPSTGAWAARYSPSMHSQFDPLASRSEFDTTPELGSDQHVNNNVHPTSQQDTSSEEQTSSGSSYEALPDVYVDPRLYSDILYRTVYHPDLSVDEFIANLLSRPYDGGQTNHKTAQVQRIDPLVSSTDPDSVAINTFWHKKSAKMMLMPHPTGPKRLLVSYVRTSWFLAYGNGPGYVGVWQLGEPQLLSAFDSQRPLTSLFLHGFYSARVAQYRNLGEQPEHAGSYWITVRRSLKMPTLGMKLRIIGMSDEEIQRVDDKIQGEERWVNPTVLEGSASNPSQYDANALLSTYPVDQAFHIYSYKETPEVFDLVRKLHEEAGLPETAFAPIELTEDEMYQLGEKMGQAFRSRRQVKIWTLDTGETYMLAYHQTLAWLKQHTRQVLSIWKFGRTMISGHRVAARELDAIGLFHISLNSWRKLNERNIPGLRDSHFHFAQRHLP